MILFCDTSALVKLYVAEVASDQVRELASQAMMVAVSRVAWAEAMAAFARRARENPAESRAIESAKHAFRDDWSDLAVVEVTQSVVELAGDHAETFALRGYDSVQLASGQTLQQASEDSLCFACFDAHLSKAAGVLGMQPVRAL